MQPPPPQVTERLLQIVHLGLVEARNIALRHNNPQLSDLADALESMPEEMANWKDHSLEAIRFNLRTYEEKYPNRSFDYARRLDD